MRIVKYPHPTLRHKSKSLSRVDAELRKIVAEMFDIMHKGKGVGLAANQVDLPYRLFVINATGDEAAKDEQYALINPVIVKRSGSAEDEEGCLSLPEIYAQVRRAEKIVLSAYTLEGKEIEWELSGFLARVVQHECDHLDGTLFIDRLGPSSLMVIKEALSDLEREYRTEHDSGRVPSNAAIEARLAELEALRT